MTRKPKRRYIKRTAHLMPPPPDADVYTIDDFCRAHRISRPMFYKLQTRGLTPRLFRLGSKVLISREAAAAWRREREAAQVTATA